MSRRERILVAGVFLSLSIATSFVRSQQWILGSADTAFLSVITENVARTGRADNPMFPSMLAVVERIVTLPADEAATVDLSPPPQEYNHLRFHAYFVLYLIAPLAWIVPVEVLWPTLIAFSYFTLLFVSYGFLRRQGVSVQGALAFCAVVTLHPAWSHGMTGQIFVDRLFLGLGAMFLYSFTSDRPNRTHIVLLAIVCASLIERTAIVIGLFALGHTVLFWRERKEMRRFAIMLGIASIGFGALMMKLFLQNFYYTPSGFMPTSVEAMVQRFSDPVFTANTLTFLAINLTLLGILAAFQPRALLLALAMLIPNVIGNIGGAAKVVWVTHYHCTYFPFLVWAAAHGMAALHRRIEGVRWQTALQVGAVAIAFVVGGVGVRGHAFRTVLGELPSLVSRQGREQRFAAFEKLRRAIPVGSSVSGPENMYPALYRGRTLNLFPIGLEEADYAIPVVVSFLGEENRLALEEGLRERMAKAGYDMTSPIRCGHFDVYRRSKAP